MISLVKIRELDHDEEFSLRGWTLQKAIDVSAGSIQNHGFIVKTI